MHGIQRSSGSPYWGHFEPIIQYNKATGRTMAENDLPLFLGRIGYFEEIFSSFQFITDIR